jgi:hypothetical protein
MELLERSSTLALSSIESASPQAEGLKAIVDFAQSIANQNNGPTSAPLLSLSSYLLFSESW